MFDLNYLFRSIDGPRAKIIVISPIVTGKILCSSWLIFAVQCSMSRETLSPFTLFILLHKKFLQFDWLRALVFQLNLQYPGEIPTCENYKPFAGSSIKK